MSQYQEKITLVSMMKALDKKWIIASIMLFVMSAVLNPSPVSYEAPLTLGILQDWVFSMVSGIAGMWALIKAIMNADMNKW